MGFKPQHDGHGEEWPLLSMALFQPEPAADINSYRSCSWSTSEKVCGGSTWSKIGLMKSKSCCTLIQKGKHVKWCQYDVFREKSKDPAPFAGFLACWFLLWLIAKSSATSLLAEEIQFQWNQPWRCRESPTPLFANSGGAHGRNWEHAERAEALLDGGEREEQTTKATCKGLRDSHFLLADRWR